MPSISEFRIVPSRAVKAKGITQNFATLVPHNRAASHQGFQQQRRQQEMRLCYIILYYNMLHSTILHYTILYCVM